jgi:sec-independent protein translocase protein TatB
MVTMPASEVANLGMADSLILMVMALVVFGPRRLPQIGRQIGKLMYEFRKASNDFKFQMEEELRSAEDADRRKKEEEERARMMTLAPPAQSALTEGDAQVVDSEASEAAPTEPAAVEGTSNESPYPYESNYPSVTATGAPLETVTTETYPRIQPPTTGEPVPAAPPTGGAVDAEAMNGPEPVATQGAADASADAGKEAVAAPAAAPKRTRRKKKEAAVEPNDGATEEAARHG